MNTAITTTNPAATADYACLLAEAGYVLSAVVESTTLDRHREFKALQAMYSEAITSDMAVVLHSSHAPLAHHLSSMFSSIMATGAILTPYDSDELPIVAVIGVHAIEKLTKAISDALDSDSPDAHAENILRESMILEYGMRDELQQPAAINLLSAVAIADARMAAFTVRLTTA